MLAAGAVIALGVAVAACSASNDARREESGSSRFTEDSAEYKLAVIDGVAVDPVSDENEIVPYGRALNRLQEECPNPRVRLADMAVATQDLLADEFIDLSLLEILNAVAASIPAGAGQELGLDCTEVFATWATLTIG